MFGYFFVKTDGKENLHRTSVIKTIRSRVREGSRMRKDDKPVTWQLVNNYNVALFFYLKINISTRL